MKTKEVISGGMKPSIEKGIPFPKYTKRPSNDLSSDLKKMEPGDSRLITTPFSEQSLNATRTRVHYVVSRNKMNRKKFTVNKDPFSDNLRVWRIS